MQIALLRNQRDFHLSAKTIFQEPFKQAYKNFSITFCNKAYCSDQLEPLSISKKIVCLFTALIYCVPIINTIIFVSKEILGSYKHKIQWKKYYENHPLNKLTDNNLKILKKSLSSAILSINFDDSLKYANTQECNLAELEFNSEGKLKNVYYGHSLWDEGYEGRGFNLKNDSFYVLLSIQISTSKAYNHNPYYLEAEDLEYYKEHYPPRIQETLELMLDKLNNKYAELALVNFKKSQYDPLVCKVVYL
ncbi:Uncharacterized protein NEOC65_000775 [Neochlamydia sp. AcF65]|uniref:hypothetical protein n=1 Tax=unclassified Neochlamydia TaxID=2643326 RepID=UPI00140D05AB|nr:MULTISPECIES: hypothetical protein [unclassified Neochlamydia]MBS4165710.1 Uncharacterized protein [Neochlamydia sp. AcF65]NGY95318.1 hypothetical protein [Neochlamydia sp. AcF84]